MFYYRAYRPRIAAQELGDRVRPANRAAAPATRGQDPSETARSAACGRAGLLTRGHRLRVAHDPVDLRCVLELELAAEEPRNRDTRGSLPCFAQRPV